MTIAIDDAFVQAFIDGAFGLPIAYENEQYEPVGQTPYVQLIIAQNPAIPLEGSLASRNEITGTFRCVLRYPADQGALDAKEKAESILSAFPIGSTVTSGGQQSIVTQAHRNVGQSVDGWFTIVVAITFRTLVAR